MKKDTIAEKYHNYRDKIGNRRELYKAVARKYGIHSALYPGSHIDIAPSLVIPKVTYVDNFRGAIQFFKDLDSIRDYIGENKDYEGESEVVFKGEDYTEDLDLEPVDLIISQYAGFVGQATKKYLKAGGILLCNDSHGDATLATYDEDFEFIGVVSDGNRIIDKGLDAYFRLSGDMEVDVAKVRGAMKGPKYSKKAENYLFQKIR